MVKINKISYRYKLFICIAFFFLLIIIPINMMLYSNIQKTMKEEMIDANRSFLTQLKNATAITLVEADKAFMQVTFDSSIEELAKDHQDLTYSEFTVRSERIENILASNIYFSTCYVYYFMEEMVLDVNITTPLFRELKHSNQREYIQKSVESYIDNPKVGQLPLYKIKVGEEERLTFLKPINAASASPKALLIVEFTPKYFNYILNSVKINENASVYIYDNDGYVITRKSLHGDHIDMEEIVKDEELTTSNYVTKSISGVDYLICKVESSKIGWNFIYTIPLKQVYKKINYVKKYIWIVMIFCSLLILITDFIISGVFSRPIKKLLDIMRVATSGGHSHGYRSDIHYIENNLINIIDVNKDLKRSIKDSRPLLKTAIIKGILKKSLDLNNIWDRIDFYDIKIVKEAFYFICMIEIDDYNSYKLNYSEKQLELLEVYQKELIHQFLENANLIGEYITGDENEKILVVSLQPEENYSKTLVKFSNNIHNLLSNNMNFTISVGVSELVKSIDELYNAYNQAKRAIEYKIVRGRNNIIFYDQVPKYNNWCYTYPYAIEEQLINQMKLGSKEKIALQLGEYFNYARGNINETSIKYAFVHLLDSIVQYLSNTRINIEEIYIRPDNLYDDLVSLETINDVHKWFSALLNSILDYIEEKKSNKSNYIVEKIKEYIDKNYCSDQISLDSLADDLHYSVSYMGKLFRNWEGISIKKYITQKRIAEAKMLLINTDKKVKDIGVHVGYVNEHSFINMFKKMNGLSPGEYRNKHVS